MIVLRTELKLKAVGEEPRRTGGKGWGRLKIESMADVCDNTM